jgi:hypothetical protein
VAKQKAALQTESAAGLVMGDITALIYSPLALVPFGKSVAIEGNQNGGTKGILSNL